MDILPIVLWGIGVLTSFGECVYALVSSKYRSRSTEPDVLPPSLTAIAGHLVAVICFVMALVIASYCIDLYDARMHDFYGSAIPVGGVIAIVLLALQIVLLYMQSRRAMLTEMNRRLNRYMK
ncbi:hypothetical protein KIH75_01395 [Bifidobacterium sp. 64T4]|uniref:hypothetical protein n=1 Tax=Bifidobacterium pongonis TaxID=2834432 RepID=UPI001C592936|nr:hypothetical protein [Bifidobacterium pongonis]MBW3094026.1 hypothetical protein [Bifidobacterium pongonis]